MVRLDDDIDGCGCLQCQEVDYRVVHRSLAGALAWSLRLPVRRPSVLVVFLAVGAVQLLGFVVPPSFAVLTALVGVLGVFFGRGYAGVVGSELLGSRNPSPLKALAVVVRRLPAFVAAVVTILAILSTVGFLVVALVTPGLERLLVPAGVDAITVETGLLVVLGLSLVYLLVKFVFVPEACFVGGYGPVESLRVSWAVTSLHRRKAVLIVVGFGLLLALGVVLDTQLADPGSPVTLTAEIGDTMVVLRSFGFSLASTVRFGFDVGVTALYSGVFAHQYVSGVVGAY